MGKKKPSADELLTQLRALAAVKRQSNLFRWFNQNYVEVRKVLTEQPSPGWDAIASVIQTAGISKPDGSPVTAAYARGTWWKVEQRRAKGPAPVQASPVLPGSPPAPPPPALPAPVRSGIFDPEPEGIGYSFDNWKPATLKGMAKSPQPEEEPDYCPPTFKLASHKGMPKLPQPPALGDCGVPGRTLEVKPAARLFTPELDEDA